jgi:hypothetical protein
VQLRIFSFYFDSYGVRIRRPEGVEYAFFYVSYYGEKIIDQRSGILNF